MLPDSVSSRCRVRPSVRKTPSRTLSASPEAISTAAVKDAIGPSLMMRTAPPFRDRGAQPVVEMRQLREVGVVVDFRVVADAARLVNPPPTILFLTTTSGSRTDGVEASIGVQGPARASSRRTFSIASSDASLSIARTMIGR